MDRDCLKVYISPLFVHEYWPSTQDFFYVCPAHLQDRHFCTPIIDTEGEAKREKEEAMAKEIEKVKKEYEEKQRRKKEKAKDDKEKDNDESKEKDKDASNSKSNDEKERDDKVITWNKVCIRVTAANRFLRQIDSIKSAGTETKTADGPRIFELHKFVSFIHICLIYTDKFNRTFYQMRIDRLRGIEMAKRNQERMKNPSLFPSVPSREL